MISEWWRIKEIVSDSLSKHDYQTPKDTLNLWLKNHVVTSSYFECLLDIYITQITSANTSKLSVRLTKTDHKTIQDLLSSDCQRGINLAVGAQKQTISKKWKSLKSLYDEYCKKEKPSLVYSKSKQSKISPNTDCQIKTFSKKSEQREIISKDKIQKKFESILKTHNEALGHLRTLDFNHDSLQKIKQELVSDLEGLIANISDEYKTVQNDIVWDHLVIGFFGETNAGKSTIIETLRLRYSSNKDSWIHGEIVGLGEDDFTKDASEYELDINGKRVTLIDIPGIEGDESKYTHIIAKALRKAHFVFYVHKKNSKPDIKIASRIQHYLSDWTRVCSIYNVSNSIGNYDEAEDRVNLYTDSVINQGNVIKSAFREILGSIYEENITLQAQVGLCASSMFTHSVKLSKDAKKLRQYFNDAETAYKFSHFNSLIELLDRLNISFDKVITDSQNQKLKALKKQSLLKLEKFEIDHRNLLSQLEKRFRDMTSDIKSKIQSSKRIIKNRCDSIINKTFCSIESSIYETIDHNKKDQNKLEQAIRNILWRNLKESMPYEINNECMDITKVMIQEINNRIKELNYLNIRIKNPDIALNFQYYIDTESIIHHLKVSLGDVLDVVGGAAGLGAAFGAFGGPIGIGIGALLGAGATVAKKTMFGDGGTSKAKNAAKDELDVIRADCKDELRRQLKSIEDDFIRFQNYVISAISKEIVNLQKMQNKTKDIYTLI